MSHTRDGFNRLLTVLGCVVAGVLFLTPPAHAAPIAHVQSAGASNNATGPTLAVAFPSANTAGNLIVASISFDTTGGTTWSCSDSLGNTYLKATSVNDTRHSQLLGICYAANIKAGANSVTLTLGSVAQSFRRLGIHEYSGAATVNPLDKTATNTATGTTTPGSITSTAVTPTQPGSLIFGAVMADSGTTTVSAGTTLTLRQSVGSGFASEDEVQSTVASRAATFTFGTARDYLAHVAAFKPSSTPPPDGVPPTASMTAPAGATTVGGTAALVSATASDNIGVVGAQFLLDNAPLGAEDTTPPYSISWDTTTAANGPHTLSVRARDAAGNTATSTTVSVTVDNQAPAGTAVINGGAQTTTSTAVTLTLSATDALSPVTEMRFSNTGLSFSPAEPYATTKAWTLSSGAGTKTVYAQYKDGPGNWSSSFTDTITLDSTSSDTAPPSVPANLTATVVSAARIDLSWNAATDDVGVTGYTVFRDSLALATTPGPSFSDTTVTATSTYTYAVSAFDAAGNTSPLSAPVTVSTGQSVFAGPLRTNPINHRYFTDDTGRAIYLTGSHTWSSFSNNGLTDPPQVFDYRAYLDMLENSHHNFIRLWSGWEQAKWNAFTTNPYWFEINPFARTGPGTAPDGKPKFDLTRLNQAFFDRLRQRVIEAGQRRMYVAVMLFNGWSVAPLGGGASPFDGHPMNSAYNINGINGDPNGDRRGDEVHRLQIPAITALQEAYVRKVIDTVNDLDNVVYEICNECFTDSIDWHYHMINVIKAYEAGLPKQHPVGMSDYPGGGGIPDLLASPADWIAPGGTVSSPTHVVMSDTDHFCGVCQDRVWAWKEFMQGANVMLMDGYGSDDYASMGHPGTDFYTPFWTNYRNNLGYIRDYANRVNLNLMTPKGSPMFSTGYGMANASSTNGEYLGYLPNGGSVTINLSATPGSLSVEWLNPATGAITQAASITGGASRTLTAPFSGDAAVYVRNVVSDTTRPTAPGNLNSSGGLGAASLTWSAATDNVGVTGYNVHRAVSSGFTPGPANKVGQTSNLSYTDNVAAGTYYYVVTAQDAAGNVSVPSNQGSAIVTADTQPPSVPTNLQGSNVSASSATVSWTASVDNVAVAGYQVFRNGTLIASTTQASYPDSGLSPSTTYAYTVTAYDASNNVSGYSQALNITTTAGSVQPPAFVQLREGIASVNSNNVATGTLTAAVTNGNLVVAWIWYNSGTQFVSSVTDSKGNSYVRGVGPTTGTGTLAGWRQELWYAKNVIGGTGLAVTASFPSTFSAEKAIIAHEYSGLDRVSPVDAAVATVSSLANASSDSAALSTSKGLVFAAALFQGSGSSGSGFAQRSSLQSNVSEDRIVSAAGSYAATFSNTAQSSIIQMILFK